MKNGRTDFDLSSSLNFRKDNDNFDGQEVEESSEKITYNVKESNELQQQKVDYSESSATTAINENIFTLPNEPEIIWHEKITTVLDNFVNQAQFIFNFHHTNRIIDNQNVIGDQADIFYEENGDKNLVDHFATRFKGMSDIVVVLLSIGFILLIFIFGHNFLIKNSKERNLIQKMNDIERKLFLSEKESSVAKTKLLETQKKIENITNMSFGTDDMIKQREYEKNELREHIASLEKELEIAAEAGLELNKMVTELLEKSGSDSIVNSVEELQKQLNDQEEATVYINNLLAEKSRENSELKVMLKSTNESYVIKIDELNTLNEILRRNKEVLETKADDIQMLETQLKNLLEKKEYDIKNLKEEIIQMKNELAEILPKWQSSAAQAELLRNTLKNLNNLSQEEKQSISEKIEVNANFLVAKKEIDRLKDCLNIETDNNSNLRDQIRDLNEDLNRLKIEKNQCEKQKLEALTRLDVLSSYFKDKESQLQK